MIIIFFRFYWRFVFCVYLGCIVGFMYINKWVLLCFDVDCYDVNFGFGLKWVFVLNCFFVVLIMYSCGEIIYSDYWIMKKKNIIEGVLSYKMILSVLKFLLINYKI